VTVLHLLQHNYVASRTMSDLRSIYAAAAQNFVRLKASDGWLSLKFNLLTPNVNYSGRTAPLTSKVAFYIFIQQI